MSDKARILAFAGSTRRESWNKKLIRVAVKGAKSVGAEVTLVDLADYPMPLYDGDLEQEKGIPEYGLKFKQLMKEHDGILLSCPEYNSSISGVLKNTIDW
ncbi:MAG: NAD(P)H-dependent oxidoreductase, partial [Gammaproteobacteria bacterium]|nr:NAD(P)H-dependent oxidoreductase [Gammaproteobacteria bacterium]